MLNGTSHERSPEFGHLKNDTALLLKVDSSVGYLLEYSPLKEVVQTLAGIRLIGVFVRILKGLLNDIPHYGGILLAFLHRKEISIFIKGIRTAVPAAGFRIGLLCKIQHAIVVGPVDPVRSYIYQVAVGQSLLVQAAPKPVSSFEDCHLKAILKKYIGAPKTSKTSADNSDVSFVRLWRVHSLQSCGLSKRLAVREDSKEATSTATSTDAKSVQAWCVKNSVSYLECF